jgi:hypothetical protein
MGLKDAETWKPKEWHIHTKDWSPETKKIAREMFQTPDDGQRVSEDSVDKMLKGKPLENINLQRINLVRRLSSLSDEALYRMITSFQMSPCSVDVGALRYEHHPKINRRRRFRG